MTAPHRPPPRRLGDYELLEEIGAGGMGTVYRARHSQTGVTYAVKTLTSADPELLARFQREGECQARVDDHPHVVRVRSLGREGATCYLVMDLAGGGSLEERLAEGLPTPAQAASWVRELAGAVEHAHQRGVLHRDLKPHNVLFEGDVPLLVDFGLAKLMDAKSLTESGTALGTPGYMAPEQVDHARGAVGPAADVYGLGALLYRCLTGRAPFQGSSVLLTLRSVLEQPPAPPGTLRAGIPPALEAECLRALAKAPLERHPSAREFGEALGAALAAETHTGSGGTLAWALAPLVILGAAALALLNQPSRSPSTTSPRPAAPNSPATPTSPPTAPPTPARAAVDEAARTRDCPGPHDYDGGQAKALRHQGQPEAARDILLNILCGAPCRVHAVALRELGCVYETEALLDMGLAQAYWLRATLAGDTEAAWRLGGSLLPVDLRPFTIVVQEHEPDAARAMAALWLASQWDRTEDAVTYQHAVKQLSASVAPPTSEAEALRRLGEGRAFPELPPLPEAPTRPPMRWALRPDETTRDLAKQLSPHVNTPEIEAEKLAEVREILSDLLSRPPSHEHPRAYEYMGWAYVSSADPNRQEKATQFLVRAALSGDNRAPTALALELLEPGSVPFNKQVLGLTPDLELALAFLALADEAAPPDNRGTVTNVIAIVRGDGRSLPPYEDAYARVWEAFPDAR
jgi:serine/threonine protein kinase